MFTEVSITIETALDPCFVGHTQHGQVSCCFSFKRQKKIRQVKTGDLRLKTKKKRGYFTHSIFYSIFCQPALIL